MEYALILVLTLGADGPIQNWTSPEGAGYKLTTESIWVAVAGPMGHGECQVEKKHHPAYPGLVEWKCLPTKMDIPPAPSPDPEPPPAPAPPAPEPDPVPEPEPTPEPEPEPPPQTR